MIRRSDSFEVSTFDDSSNYLFLFFGCKQTFLKSEKPKGGGGRGGGGGGSGGCALILSLVGSAGPVEPSAGARESRVFR